MNRDSKFIETHSLPPFLPSHARLLMLGSFPPPRARWKMDFYYPNFQNDMWRIFGLVFFADADYFVAEGGKAFKEALLRDFLAAKGIAISDAAYRVVRMQGNAADKFLQVVEPVDLAGLLAQIPHCHTLMTTGDKATDTLLSVLPIGTTKPRIGRPSHACMGERQLAWHRLPSSSRAYPMVLAEKAAAYAAFFETAGLRPW